MARAKVIAVDDPQETATQMIIEAMVLIELLTDYAAHYPSCPHPHKTCDCGLPELLVKAKLFGSG